MTLDGEDYFMDRLRTDT